VSLAADLAAARALDVDALADAIEAIGFECTDCGACCRSDDCGEAGDSTESEHTATVFPDEIRALQAEGRDWRDVARPMPYGLEDGAGETFEWALQTDACGDCTFHDDAAGRCTVYDDRPLICRTYPFSVALGETSQPLGGVVERRGPVQAHECEGLGRDIDRADAEDLAAALKERAIRELEEAIAVRDNYAPTDADGVVVHDSEGQKRPDGTPLSTE
jgi:Fe-S-cluster containining protein